MVGGGELLGGLKRPYQFLLRQVGGPGFQVGVAVPGVAGDGGFIGGIGGVKEGYQIEERVGDSAVRPVEEDETTILPLAGYPDITPV